MATVSYHLNRVVSSRYIKLEDVDAFLTVLCRLRKCGVKCKPAVSIFRSNSHNKKSLDILLDTGVRAADLKGKISGSSLYLQTEYSNDYYHTDVKIDTTGLMANLSGRDCAYELFQKISTYILRNVDSDVELRGLRKKMR